MRDLIRLEPRREPSRTMLYVTPFLAFALTLVAGALLFAALGKDPFRALNLIFITPLTGVRGIAELTVKATPLILIATGLSVGFRAGIWNIGAEGQYTVGAICGGALALFAYPGGGPLLMPAMVIAGLVGGMAWAAIPAFLRVRYGASEILTSLMLVYVAGLLLVILVQGPLRDPQSFNFPESRLFQPSALLPLLAKGTRAHLGFVLAVLGVAAAQLLMTRHVLGFMARVSGDAPRAASFAGFSGARTVWLSFLISGGLAGVAGICEAAGPVGQLVPQLPQGYGFSAIIVAFLGRLQPLGILAAGLLLGLVIIGGETAQVTMSLPSATIPVFQGLLLFFVLASDVLVENRVRLGRRHALPSEAA